MLHGKSYTNDRYGKLVGQFYRKKVYCNTLGYHPYKDFLFAKFKILLSNKGYKLHDVNKAFLTSNKKFNLT